MTNDEPEVMGDVEQFASFYRLNNLLDAAAGATPIPFEGLQDHERSAWADCFESARRIVREGEGKTYDRLGRDLFDAMKCSLNPADTVSWDAITPAQRLKWPLLIRHIVEMFVWNSDDPHIGDVEQDLVGVFESLLASTPQEVENVATQ